MPGDIAPVFGDKGHTRSQESITIARSCPCVVDEAKGTLERLQVCDRDQSANLKTINDHKT